MAKRNGHETVDHVQDPMVSGEPVAHMGDTNTVGFDQGAGGDSTATVTTANGQVVAATTPRTPRAPLSAQEAVRLILTTLKRVGDQAAQDKVLNAVSALR